MIHLESNIQYQVIKGSKSLTTPLETMAKAMISPENPHESLQPRPPLQGTSGQAF
jgi:hypothetical protein